MAEKTESIKNGTTHSNTQMAVVDDYDPQTSSNNPTRLKVGRTSYSITTPGK